MTTRFGKFARYLGLVIAITIGWLGYVEAVCYARLWVANPATDLISRERLKQVYQNADWVDAYADEWAPSNFYSYASYIAWERRPFSGKAINIDANNMRLTAHSHCEDKDAFTIWMFGGSTVWGAGVPDWLTVPSQLAEMYEKDGRNVCVRNYAQDAYVDSQEVVQLTLELKKTDHRKPDIVIFYDGPGDVYETYQSGKAGEHQNFHSMSNEFEKRSAPGSGNFQYLMSTNTARVLFLSGQQSHMEGPKNPSFIAEETIRNYKDNVRFVQALSREYGFVPAFFWQPDISLGKKHLTKEEQIAADAARQRSPKLDEANQAAYALIEADCSAPLFCIADAFDQADGTIYFDNAHVDAEGNRLIAKKMYDALHAQPAAATSMACTSGTGSPTTLK